MGVVIDEPGGNQGVDLGVTGITAAKDRQRPYAWTCYNCGTQNVGFIEDGCSSCPMGHGNTQGEPLPPTDYNCRACHGRSRVERKCGTCNGTGSIGVQVEGMAPPQPCTTCGGAGVVGMDCARCAGTGIDPEPQIVERKLEKPMEQKSTVNPEPTSALPSLDAPVPPGAQVGKRRYFVVELAGPGDVVDLLAKHEQGTSSPVRRVQEIASSPTTDRLFPPQ